MRLYITGGVGSGKTTLARRLSAATGIPCCHLDELVYEPDPDNPGDDRKRPPEARDALFAEVIARPRYIIEDAGRECFAEGMRRADRVIFLDLPRRVRLFRVVRRWIRQNLGLEACIYRPDWAMLGSMLRWTMEYRGGARPNLLPFAGKLVALRSRRDIERYLDSLR